MRQKKRWLALLSAAVLLAGCAGGEDENTSDSSKNSDVAASTEVVDPENTKDVPEDEIDVMVEDMYTEQGQISDPKVMDEFAEKAELVHVIDGDTVVVSTEKGEETVRLLLVDTPEMEDEYDDEGRPEPYAEEAKTYLAAHLDGASLYLERGENDTDEYGRTLGYIWRTDGDKVTNVSADIIQAGYGRVAYVFAPNIRYVDTFFDVENAAMDERSNIWEHPGYASEEGFDRTFIEE